MTRDAIAERLNGFIDDVKRPNASTGSVVARAQAEQVVFLGEIAAQLAELNERLSKAERSKDGAWWPK